MNGQGFVHLRVRSAYSLLEGAIKASEDRQAWRPASPECRLCAITDRANLFGALEFSQYHEGRRASSRSSAAPCRSAAWARAVGALGAGRPTVVLLAQNERAG